MKFTKEDYAERGFSYASDKNVRLYVEPAIKRAVCNVELLIGKIPPSDSLWESQTECLKQAVFTETEYILGFEYTPETAYTVHERRRSEIANGVSTLNNNIKAENALLLSNYYKEFPAETNADTPLYAGEGDAAPYEYVKTAKLGDFSYTYEREFPKKDIPNTPAKAERPSPPALKDEVKFPFFDNTLGASPLSVTDRKTPLKEKTLPVCDAAFSILKMGGFIKR